MAYPRVKLTMMNAEGDTKTVQWQVTDDFQSFSNVINFGCTRLGIQNNFNLRITQISNDNGVEEKTEIENLEEFLNYDRSYYIMDTRINNGEPLLAAKIPKVTVYGGPFSASSNHPSVVQVLSQHPSTQSSRMQTAQVVQQPPSSSQPSPENDFSPAPKSLKIHGNCTKTERLTSFFLENNEAIDKAYATYSSSKPIMFGGVDVYQHFLGKDLGRTAVYVFREHIEALLEAAESKITQLAKEVIKAVTPDFSLPATERHKINHVINKLTASDVFNKLSLSNGKGPVDRTSQRKYNEAKNVGKVSLPKPRLCDESIDKIVTQINNSTTVEGKRLEFQSSSFIRALWIQEERKKPSYVDNRQGEAFVSSVISKFPDIKGDITLIHHDFLWIMKKKKNFQPNLNDVFRRMLPEIFNQAAMQQNCSEVPASLTDDMKEYHGGRLLAELIKKGTKRSESNYSRLVIDCMGSCSHHDGLTQLTHHGINSPAIIALGTVPRATYYIAVGKEALQVNGTFADALQSYMETIFVFNLAYDKDTRPIAYFFELMMGMKTNNNPARQQLFDVLHRPLPRNDQSTSQASAQFELPSPTHTANENQRRSEEEHSANMFNETSQSPSTPKRRRIDGSLDPSSQNAIQSTTNNLTQLF